jgi:hypothetical protein
LEHTRCFGTYGQKDRGFLSANFRRVSAPRAEVSQLLARFLGADISPSNAVVAIPDVNACGHALQVLRAVICLALVLVVNLLFGVKVLQPASRHNAVRQSSPSDTKVTAGVFCGGVWLEVSKELPSARYGVKMVKHTVFRAIHRKANHVGLQPVFVT